MRSSRRAPVRSLAPVSVAISPTVKPTGCLKKTGNVNASASRMSSDFLLTTHLLRSPIASRVRQGTVLHFIGRFCHAVYRIAHFCRHAGAEIGANGARTAGQ